MSKSRFLYVTYIRTTPEKLWEALTNPEFTKRYWCEVRNESTWKKDADWKLVAPDGRVADSGKVLEIDPPRRLVVSWKHELLPDVRDEVASRATFELEQAADSVKLTVIHESDVPDSKIIRSVSGGWPAILASLKSLLETGAALEVTAKWPKGM